MKNSSLIVITLVLLGVYNLLYWPGKFLGIFQGFYHEIKETWYLFIFLELLAIESIFVDLIVRWDSFGHNEKRLRLFLTSLFFIAFITRFGFGFMEDYLTGDVK